MCIVGFSFSRSKTVHWGSRKKRRATRPTVEFCIYARLFEFMNCTGGQNAALINLLKVMKHPHSHQAFPVVSSDYDGQESVSTDSELPPRFVKIVNSSLLTVGGRGIPGEFTKGHQCFSTLATNSWKIQLKKNFSTKNIKYFRIYTSYKTCWVSGLYVKERCSQFTYGTT